MTRIYLRIIAALFIAAGLTAPVDACAQTAAAAEPDIYSNSDLLDLLSRGAAADTVLQAPQLQPGEIVTEPTVTPQNTTRIGRRTRKSSWREPEWWKDPSKLPLDTTLDLSHMKVPTYMMVPPVYNNYDMLLPQKVDNSFLPAEKSGDKAEVYDNGIAREAYASTYWRLFMQNWMIAHPDQVPYIADYMEQPPQTVVIKTDPSEAKITVQGFDNSPEELKKAANSGLDLGRINWIHSFDGSLQFSQAYLSPNWYQGGNSNLNMIANAIWNVKLNPAFHPNLIFETQVSYKLGMNNAPEDSVHKYNISDDIFQLTSKFGVRAARKWFYSINVLFKTQLLNSYKKNSNDMIAAFLSPAELNVGLGMTYSNTNARKTVEFNASIAPLSYNLKTCTNDDIDPTQFGIKRGHTTVNNFGSSAELTFKWKLRYNIDYNSRLFLFTNYEYVQGDWEHTINFAISRFFSTRIYAHLRYDSDTKKVEGTRWHHWQLKEILSIGFSYKFAMG